MGAWSHKKVVVHLQERGSGECGYKGSGEGEGPSVNRKGAVVEWAVVWFQLRPMVPCRGGLAKA